MTKAGSRPLRMQADRMNFTMVSTNISQTIALVGLGIEVAGLRQLSKWEPVGSLLAVIVDATRGTGGLTRKELRRLRLWGKRWRALHPDVRSFYEEETRDSLTAPDMYIWSKAVDSALWKILNDEVGVKPTAALYRAMSTLWVVRYGTEPTMELIPNLTHIQLRSNDAPSMHKEVDD